MGEDDDEVSRQARTEPADTGDTRTLVSSDSSSYPSARLRESPTAIQPGDVLGDRYRVIERLGKGGMGEVHLAEHIAIGRRVAIKTLSGDLREHADLARRFLQEARTASKVRHPNIVDITDFGHTERGVPFFVMELLEGEDLKTLLRREQTLPWPRACAITGQICAALVAAHEQGVVHRDMKPDNVFLIEQGNAEHVKVLDFGIAKISDENSHDATRTGVLLGTPNYMSPEQAQEDPLDARSDIYSVGIILFRMVTGRVPFGGKSFMKVLAMHMHDAPPLPQDLAPEGTVPDAAQALILKCLAKRPEDRYQSSQALAEALLESLEPSPVIAPLVEEEPTIAPASGGALRALAVVALLAGIATLAWVLLSGTRDPEQTPLVTAVEASAAEESSLDTPVPSDTNLDAATTSGSGSGSGSDGGPTAGSSSAGTSTAGADADPEGDTASPSAEDPPSSPKVKKKTDKRAPQKAKSALSPGDLNSASKSVRKALAACSGGLPGMVIRVDVTVSPKGKVTDASARKPQRGSALGNCVEQAAKRARFPRLLTAQDATVAFRLP